MLAPMMMKAAAIGVAGVMTAVGYGMGGSGPQGSQVTVAPPGAAATQPATQPTTQDALAAAAAIDAANLPPSEEVIERVLVPSEQGNHEIDLDTGRSYGPEDYSDEDQVFFQGVDLILSRSPLTPGLRGLRMTGKPVVADAWNLKPAASELGDLWGRPTGGQEVLFDAIGELPRSFLFRTHQGAGGVLQIVERISNAEGEPDSIRFRYKLLVRGEGTSVAEQIEAQQEAMARQGMPEEWTDDEKWRASAMREALQQMMLHAIEGGRGQWPDDIEAAREFAGDRWPDALPETLLYVQPEADPGFPQSPHRPVLFERNRVPEPTVAGIA